MLEPLEYGTYGRNIHLRDWSNAASSMFVPGIFWDFLTQRLLQILPKVTKGLGIAFLTMTKSFGVEVKQKVDHFGGCIWCICHVLNRVKIDHIFALSPLYSPYQTAILRSVLLYEPDIPSRVMTVHVHVYKTWKRHQQWMAIHRAIHAFIHMHICMFISRVHLLSRKLLLTSSNYISRYLECWSSW